MTGQEIPEDVIEKAVEVALSTHDWEAFDDRVNLISAAESVEDSVRTAVVPLVWAAAREQALAEVAAETVTIPTPHVPYGPEGVPVHEADAAYLESAADNLRWHTNRGRGIAGSNLTNTVEKLLRDSAAALRRKEGGE